METFDLDWHYHFSAGFSRPRMGYVGRLEEENVDWLAAWAENLWIGSWHLTPYQFCDGYIRSRIFTLIFLMHGEISQT